MEDVFLELCLERALLPEISVHNGNNQSTQVNTGNQQHTIPQVQIIVEESDGNRQESSSSSSSSSSDRSIEQIEMSQIPKDLNNNDNNNNNNMVPATLPIPPIHPNAPQSQMDNKNSTGKGTSQAWLDYGRFTALLAKNYLLYRRNPVSIILMNVIPLVQVTLFCVTFARNPENIPVAIVNFENHSLSLSNVSV